MTSLIASAPRHSDDQQRHDRLIWWFIFTLMSVGGLMIAAFARRRFGEPFLGLSLAILLVMVLSWTIPPPGDALRHDLPDRGQRHRHRRVVPVREEPVEPRVDLVRRRRADDQPARHLAHRRVRRHGGGAVRPHRPAHPSVAADEAAARVHGLRRLRVRARTVPERTGRLTRSRCSKARPLFYILLTFAIAINVCTERRHLRYAMWWAIAGVVIQALLSIEYVSRLDPAEREALESLNEHGSTLGHNLVIVTLFGRHARGQGAAAATMILASHSCRRSTSCSSPSVAPASRPWRSPASLMLVVLFWRIADGCSGSLTPIARDRRVGYLGAFWNSSPSHRLPCPGDQVDHRTGSASAEDQSSDLYRIIEALRPQLHDPHRPTARRRVRHALLPPDPAARHQRLRAQRLSPAQLGVVDLDQDGLRRLRRDVLLLRQDDHARRTTAPSSSRGRSIWSSPSRRCSSS